MVPHKTVGIHVKDTCKREVLVGVTENMRVHTTEFL
jgi:hypothetical protein